ncbi:hypothetical protein HYH03_007894 [Edaphochlamys debaryana]|uniref:Uncharacterized protein n=1 Tax=Edaphochlamys debaryana TaxID=47281 RepID=A0A835Y2C5_9CHLO|nr:hypothetical protein HYH03_007894 [Edaphochlamys debaryana]|eukprot:KAG2493964.1 hypothetical protein HYH03_007894 [Edaphochlamys debaryana]
MLSKESTLVKVVRADEYRAQVLAAGHNLAHALGALHTALAQDRGTQLSRQLEAAWPALCRDLRLGSARVC